MLLYFENKNQRRNEREQRGRFEVSVSRYLLLVMLQSCSQSFSSPFTCLVALIAITCVCCSLP